MIARNTAKRGNAKRTGTDGRAETPGSSVGETIRVTDVPPADVCSRLRGLRYERDLLEKIVLAESARLTNAIAGLVHRRSGATIDACWSEAKLVFKRMMQRKLTTDDERLLAPIGSVVQCEFESITAKREQLEVFEDSMTELLDNLPIAAWIDSVWGLGRAGMALIIAEAGDLGDYSGPAKLWKRFGLAPIRGSMPSTWRSKSSGEERLSKAEWQDAGYSPRRRALVYRVVDSFFRGVHKRPADDRGPYFARYVEAKSRALERHPDWTKMHAHRHALAMVGKRILRDLWNQWRSAAAAVVDVTENGFGREPVASD